MKRMSITIQTMVLILLFCLSADVLADETNEPVDFTLPQLHGEDVTLSDLRGKWVVLNYWATWCAPCRKEIPELSALHDSSENIVVLGLAFEDTDIEAFDKFLEEFKPSYPILIVDVYSPPEPFGTPMALPKTIVLNPQGIPVKTFVGPVTLEDLEAVITP